MGRATLGGFSTPFKSDGSVPDQKGLGTFTLLAGTTYYFPISCANASVVGVHLGWPGSPIIITSATVEDSNLPPLEVHGSSTTGISDYDATVGNWIDEDPTTGFVGCKGTNVTATNGVVAATGDAAGGGCLFHVANTGARRMRIKIVVGATGGDVFCFQHGKE